MSQKELEMATGKVVFESAISAYENDLRYPGPEKIKSLAKALKRLPSWLISGVE
jgi:transcriptional regulator with XRE-family HTH domain